MSATRWFMACVPGDGVEEDTLLALTEEKPLPRFVVTLLRTEFIFPETEAICPAPDELPR